MGETTLTKRIEQSRIPLLIAAKMLEKRGQIRRGQNRRSTKHLKLVIWFF